MIICGQEFAFSALNANDVERMETAQKHQQAAAEAEQKRYTEECVSYPGILRSQCRMMMSYLTRSWAKVPRSVCIWTEATSERC